MGGENCTYKAVGAFGFGVKVSGAWDGLYDTCAKSQLFNYYHRSIFDFEPSGFVSVKLGNDPPELAIKVTDVVVGHVATYRVTLVFSTA